MIFRFEGNMRSGKTLGMTQWGVFLQEATNQKILSNYHLNNKPPYKVNYQYFTKWKDLQNVKNSIILFDEINTSMDSRNYKSSDQIFFSHLFQQMGKIGNTLLYTSQREHLIEKRIRDQTDYVIKCSKNWYTGHLIQEWWDTQAGAEKAFKIHRFSITKPSVFYEYYNSFEQITSQMVYSA